MFDRKFRKYQELHRERKKFMVVLIDSLEDEKTISLFSFYFLGNLYSFIFLSFLSNFARDVGFFFIYRISSNSIHINYLLHILRLYSQTYQFYLNIILCMIKFIRWFYDFSEIKLKTIFPKTLLNKTFPIFSLIKLISYALAY